MPPASPALTLIRQRFRLSWRYALLILLAIFLAAAAVNMSFAVWCARHDRNAGIPLPRQWRTGIPPGTSWRSATPHAKPWPTPNSIDEGAVRLGWRRADVRASDPSGQFAAQVDLYGWPFPCFELAQFWWPWTDPAWALPPGSQTEFTRLRWTGILFNPVLAAALLWSLFVLPIVLVRWTRSSTRLKLGHCPDCGYDLRHQFNAGCPECGWNRVTSSSPPPSPSSP